MCKFSNRIFVCYMFTLSLCPSVIFFSLLGERCQGAGAQSVYDTLHSLVSRPPPFFIFQFMQYTVAEEEKNREGLRTLITCCDMSEVGVGGGGVHDYKYILI